MTKSATLTADQMVVERLQEYARSGSLVVILGTGTSIALTNGKAPQASWGGLVEHGFKFCLEKNLVSRLQFDNWMRQLTSIDVDDLISAAEFVGRKLKAPDGLMYARWLENAFSDMRPENAAMKNAIRALQSTGVPICTLNYDKLIESVTGLDSITLNNVNRTSAWMRRESEGIFHLHGVYDDPETCVLGIRDYETTIGNDVRDLVQRTLSAFGHLLFIGCGGTFADPNFSSLVA